MRIVLVSKTSLPNAIGGGEVHMHALAKAYKQMGFEPSVLTVDGMADSTRLVRRGEYDGIPIDYVSLPFNVSKYYRDPSLNDWAVDWLKEQRVDVLHLFLFSNLLGLVPAARKLNIPVFLTALEFSYFCRRFDLVKRAETLCELSTRGFECEQCVLSEYSSGQRSLASVARVLPSSLESMLRQVPIKLLDQDRLASLGGRSVSNQIEAQRASFNADIAGVITPSSIMKRFYLANGVSESKLHFVPYGTDVSPESNGNHTNGRSVLRLGYIGRFHPLKGIHVLCDAIKLLPKDFPVEVKVFGPAEAGLGEYVTNIRSFIDQEPRIKLMGSLDRKGIVEAYKNLDALVTPSTWYENSPITMSEALACNCPVICTATEGMTDLVEDGVNGLTFPMGDSGALAACIRRLVDEPGLLDNLRGRIKPIESTFDVASRIAELYRQAISNLN